MSNFDAMVQADEWSILAAEFGRAVTYTAYGGSAATITAVWEPGGSAPEIYEDGEQAVSRGTITAHPDDVASPDLRDTFTIASEAWAVVSITTTAPLVELELEKRAHRRVGPETGRIRR